LIIVLEKCLVFLFHPAKQVHNTRIYRMKHKKIYYTCHGLSIESEIPLLLTPSKSSNTIDVMIRFINATDQLETAFHASEMQTRIRIKEVADFFIRDGSEILIDPKTDDNNIISVFVYGSCFGALLKQRGIATLHANAILLDEEKAILISGDQKAGKSTLTGAFMLNQYKIMADDVCAIRCIQGKSCVFPGTPFIKLAHESIEKLNQKILSSRIINSIYHKKRIGLNHPPIRHPIPIVAFFCIETDENTDDVRLNRLSGIDAFTILLKNVYRPQYRIPAVLKQYHSKTLFSMAQQIPFYQLQRPTNRFSAFEMRTRILELMV